MVRPGRSRPTLVLEEPPHHPDRNRFTAVLGTEPQIPDHDGAKLYRHADGREVPVFRVKHTPKKNKYAT